MENQDFEKLFEESLKNLEIEEGSIIKGKVVEIQDNGVMVNIGFKSEGFIPKHEFLDSSGNLTVKPGDEVEVFVRKKEDTFGRVRLSRRLAIWYRGWERVKEAFEEQRTINGFVVKKIKGGYEVDLKGVKAFLPNSLADLRPIKDPHLFVNRYYDFKIIKLEENPPNIIVDRKNLLLERLERKRKALLEKINEGTVWEGKVVQVLDNGAVVDLGAGLRGFLPASNLKWGKSINIRNFLKVGDNIKFKIIEADKENLKFLLSIKHLTPDPWEKVKKEYKSGDRVKGKVTGITDFGAFVEIEPGIEGLIHISEMTWSRKRIKPSDILNRGEVVEVLIKDIDYDNRKIALSLKAIMPTPWEVISKKYKVGDKIKGKVKSITPFGLFVDVGEEEDAFIHKDEISWTKKIKNLREIFSKGDEVEAVVIEVNPDEKKFNLSIKALQEDPLKTFAEKYNIGDIIEGTISRVEQFGGFVKLENDLEGLVHVSEIKPDERIKDAREVLKEGEKVKAILKSIDLENRKISLSIADYLRKEEEKEYAQFKGEGEVKVKLGDLIKL